MTDRQPTYEGVSVSQMTRGRDYQGNPLQRCTGVYIERPDGTEIIELPFWISDEEARAIELLLKFAAPDARLTVERIRELLNR
ncbi:MAG TPA: hypothetical protein VM008_09735 [Phycisphaerae bacterium]|nr:hypothetical protein [Phycisphaerae bacterium]